VNQSSKQLDEYFREAWRIFLLEFQRITLYLGFNIGRIFG